MSPWQASDKECVSYLGTAAGLSMPKAPARGRGSQSHRPKADAKLASGGQAASAVAKTGSGVSGEEGDDGVRRTLR